MPADNRRSLIYVENLADAVAVALDRPQLGGGTYYVRDGSDYSTADLVRVLAIGAGVRRPLVLELPSWVALRVGRALGRGEMAGRLAGTLQVDDSAFRSAAGWAAPFPAAEALLRTADALSSRGAMSPPPAIGVSV